MFWLLDVEKRFKEEEGGDKQNNKQRPGGIWVEHHQHSLTGGKEVVGLQSYLGLKEFSS